MHCLFLLCYLILEGPRGPLFSPLLNMFVFFFLRRIPQLLTCLVRREGQKILNLLCNIGRVHPQVTRQLIIKLLDKVFVISGVIKVEVSVISRSEPKTEADNTYQDFGYSGYHKNLI